MSFACKHGEDGPCYACDTEPTETRPTRAPLYTGPADDTCGLCRIVAQHTPDEHADRTQRVAR